MGLRGIRRLFAFSSRTRADVRRDVDDEVGFHLDMRAEELMRGGAPEVDARAQALREFGARDAAARALTAIDAGIERRRGLSRVAVELWRDAMVGLRLQRRNPGFAAVAILTLALGIGANTAIYSVLDAVLLHPLPYPEPHRIMLVSETIDNGSANNVSGGAYLDWRTHQTHFEALALVGQVTYNLRGAGTPERLAGLEVSHEFLQVLGVPTLLGRAFIPEDDRPGGSNDVVIITEELWRTRFGAARDIIGRRIILDEVPRTVVGILPAGAWLFKDDAFFVPVVLTPGTPHAARAPHWAMVLGRLAPGVTVAQADAELKAVKQRLTGEYPAFKKNWSVVVRPAVEVLGGLTRTPMLILLGAVSLVLLIACANVANLLLARGCHRQQEIAVRAALGASGGRLVRQMLVENLTLALVGGLAGIWVAYVGVAVLRNVAETIAPIAFIPRIDARVLLFSLGVTMTTAALSGVLPALRARRADLSLTLTNGGRSSTARGHQRTQSALIVVEVALTVVLLAATGLLLRSLANAASMDPGFEPARVLAFDVSLPAASYASDAKRLSFATDLVQRLRGLPGVATAGTGTGIPFSGTGWGEYFRRPDATQDVITGRVSYVSPGFLEALGTRLLAGRRLMDADNRPDAARVVVISDTTARRFYPGTVPVGQPLIIAGDQYRIVGVIADVVDRRLDAPHGPFAYIPQAFETTQMSVVVRTPLAPSSLVESIRREVAQMDPGVALANPREMERAMADSMLQRKVVLGLVAVFAVSALTLASIGLYGVLAYAVATRRREFGIRMAFGAMKGDVVRQVFGSGLQMTGVGVVLGAAGALGAGQLLASELYRVRATDPLVLTATALTVIAVTVLACGIPAWRAASADPVVALRVE